MPPLINPLTRKRWRTFRRARRAWYSLLGLGLIFAVSLVSELICNNRPLYLRMHGRHYFPVLRYYPQDRFLNDGVMTRIDYKAFLASEAFMMAPDRRVVMPPVPHGPHEILDPRRLEPHRRARVIIRPELQAGRMNLNRDGAMARPLGMAPFFPGAGDDLDGERFDAHWHLPPALREAIERRFENQPADALTLVVRSVDDPDRQAVCFLPPFQPRPEPPASIRVTLRTREHGDDAPVRLELDREGRPTANRPAWHDIPPPAREAIETLATAAFAGTSQDSVTIAWEGRPARVTVDLTELAFPHRPVPGHWMGIDAVGRDVFARILYGTRISMTFGIALVLSAMIIGTLAGGVQGFFGGWVDILGQRFIEIWSSPPFLYVMILLGAILGRSFVLLLICYGLFNWIGISYYMRAEFLRLRDRPFIEAARCQGLGHARIMFKHILPNALTPIITLFPFQLVGAVSALTALDYLGFGLPAHTPSWGQLLHQAQQFRWAWWLILYPSLALFTVMLLAVFVGEGLRNAFDPKPATRLE